MRSASRRSASTTTRGAGASLMRGGGSAAVAQPHEQLARRERDAQTLFEKPVDEREGDEAQADTDRPALARGSQVEKARDERGQGKPEEPDRRVHPEDPATDRGGSPRPARRGARVFARARDATPARELAHGVHDRPDQRGRGDRPWEESGPDVEA